MSILFWLHQFQERLSRALHHAFGPTPEEIDEARRALRGREYYELYDDRYRALSDMGIEERGFVGIVAARPLMCRDFEQLRSNEMIPPAGATVIDLGCGEGDNASYFAQLGYRVTGIDISPIAIEVAIGRARASTLAVDYRVGNVLALTEISNGAFDLATDIGCLHMLVRGQDRRSYLHAARRVLRPGGVFYLFNRIEPADVVIANEDAHILRSITFVERRWIGSMQDSIETRGCGFRSASLRQYREELEAAGFEVLCAVGHEREGFGTLLARVPQAPTEATTPH